MTPEQFIQSLNTGPVPSLTLILAQEPFWQEEIRKKLKLKLKEKWTAFEELSFSLENDVKDRLLSEMQSYSFFSQHRVFWVSGLEKISAEEFSKMAQLAQENLNWTLVGFTEKKEAFNKFLKMKEVVSVECVKPKPRELLGLVQKIAQDLGKKISVELVNECIESVGTDLMTLQQQLTLLSLYAEGRSTLSKTDLEVLGQQLNDSNVFDWVKMIFLGKRADAVSQLRGFMRNGEAPLKLLALIARQNRLFIKMKFLLWQKCASTAIAQQLKLPPFVVEEQIRLVRQFSWKQLFRWHALISGCDQLLKSSPLSAETSFESLLWGFVAGGEKSFSI